MELLAPDAGILSIVVDDPREEEDDDGFLAAFDDDSFREKSTGSGMKRNRFDKSLAYICVLIVLIVYNKVMPSTNFKYTIKVGLQRANIYGT